ncbi:MAG: carbon-nitrogen hydrolase family protein [Planctomycetales bacterium]|nr:carbon-nitrogen hydrolase family protein [Planctomycetales bacterium]
MARLLRVAAIQAEPEVLRLAASVEKAVGLLDEAAARGARLAVFPETFLCAYPAWAHASPFDDPAAKRAHRRLLEESPRVPGPETERLGAAARERGLAVAIGVNERAGHGTVLYNSLVYIGNDGRLAGLHRKLVPTHHERTVWSPGDGSTLAPVTLAGARVGGLLCFENYMPLARFSLYAQGVEVYLAPTADDREAWQHSLSHLAQEARAYVISPCILQRKSSFPADFPLRNDPAWAREPEAQVRGGTAIVAPDGTVLAGPVYDREEVLVADLDLDRIPEERQILDVAGHYARPDVFSLRVDRTARDAVRFVGGDGREPGPRARRRAGSPERRTPRRRRGES